MAPRYSIVVPTCDRGVLLQHTLRGILAIPRQDIEIVVSDNASTDETASIIEAVRHDPRVVAVRTDRRLPMPTHWDFAFAKASGDFVIMNGDDDGFSPNLFITLDSIIKSHDPKLMTWHCGLYHHPDYHAEGTPNTLHFRAGHSGLALIIDPAPVIGDYARLDFDFFPEGTRICLRRDLGLEVVRKTGRLFWPPYPDFSAPLMCLLLCKPGEYIYVDALLGFGGRSKDSNGGSWTTKRATKDRAKSFFREFSDEEIYPFHEPKLPFLYNGHAAALSVAKHFYSQEVGDLHQDCFILFCSFYEELRGIRYNPIIDGDFEARLDDYVKNAGEDVRLAAGAARRSVDDRSSANGETARRARSWMFRLRKWMPFRKTIKEMILRSGFSDSERSGLYMHSVSGDSRSIYNGYDLTRCFDSIVARDDSLTLQSVERALKKNVLISAHRI
jgi:glycosyltransferase involved in cell wall biosynthesis